MDDRGGDAGESEASKPEPSLDATPERSGAAAPVPSGVDDVDAPPAPPVASWVAGAQWEAAEAPTAPDVERRNLNVGSAFGRTLDLFIGHPLTFIVLALPGAIVGPIVGTLSLAQQANTLVVVVAVLIDLVVGVALGLAMVIAADDYRAGRSVGYESVLRRALGFTIRAVLSAVAQYLVLLGLIFVCAILLTILGVSGAIPLIAIGLILMVALVLYVLVRWSLAYAAIALEGTGPIRALGRSRFLTKGRLVRIAAVFVALAAVVGPLTIGVSFLAIIAAGSLPAIVLTSVVGLVTAPLFSIVTATVFGDLTGRPEVAPIPAPPARARGPFAAAIFLLGVIALAISIPQIGSAFDRLALSGVPVADRGKILAGTARDPADPCRQVGVKSIFTTADSIYIGGYFTKAIPRGQSGTIDVYANGTKVNSAPLSNASRSVACYYEQSPIVGGSPGTYRLVVTFQGETIAEGTFEIH